MLKKRADIFIDEKFTLLGPGQNDHYGPIQNDQLKSIKSGQRISWLNGLF